jgi:prevent-host-death family protein
MTDVSVRELKSRLSEYLRRSEGGESFRVTRRGKVIGVLSPPNGAEDASARVETYDERLERKLLALVDKGVLHWRGGKPAGLNPPIKLMGEGPTISEMILEDRR